MAAPAIIPILKKVASVVLSDKKGRKAVLMIVGIVLVIIILPIIALGAIRVQLKFNELCTLKFPIPSTIEEQRRILERLSTYDDEIRELESKAAAVLAVKQSEIDKIWFKE